MQAKVSKPASTAVFLYRSFAPNTDLPHLPPGIRAVVICKRVRKLSERAAAILPNQGVLAEALEGGTLAWPLAGLPVLPLRLMAQTDLWVTRHRPKIDRIACPWLIRRIVNPKARFLFVAPADVAGWSRAR